VIAGPSGVGKSTIVHALMREFNAAFSVSATTRAPSPEERDGVEYFFVDQTTFQRWIHENRFLEHAQVFGRDWYGTPRDAVQRQLDDGRLVILDIDVQGAENVRRAMPGMLGIFILPPDDDELLRRLRVRGREDETAIQRRFAESRSEIARAKAGTTFDAFVVNDDLVRCTEAVASIVRTRLSVASAP